jgi:predicted esterase
MARDAPPGGEKPPGTMKGLRLPLGRLMFLGASTLSAAAVCAAQGGDALDDARAQLTAARSALIAGIDRAKAHSDDAYDIIVRLDSALSSLDDGRAKTDPSYAADAALEASLDRSLVDQVLSGACTDPRSVSGTAEICFVSSQDRTLQPLAIVVPSSYRAQSSPLIVFLRGRGQTEASIAASREIRRLAESSGAIVAAPYARGRAQYDAAATQDVVDATDAVVRAFSLDVHHVYLAGFSAGAAAAFHVTGRVPGRYAALLSVAGALESADGVTATAALAGRHVYLVAGGKDDVVPAGIARDAAAFLRSHGVNVSYYEQPGGTHALRTLSPALDSAWRDMLAGVTHASSDLPGGLSPNPIPSDFTIEARPGPGTTSRP